MDEKDEEEGLNEGSVAEAPEEAPPEEEAPEEEAPEEEPPEEEPPEEELMVGRLSAPELFHAGSHGAQSGVLDSQESYAHVPDPSLPASLEMYSAMGSDVDEEEEEGRSEENSAHEQIAEQSADLSADSSSDSSSPGASTSEPAPIYGLPDAPGASPSASDLPEVPVPKKRDWVILAIALVPLLSCLVALPLDLMGYQGLLNRLREKLAFPILGLSLIAGVACVVALGFSRDRRSSWGAFLAAGSPWLLACILPTRGERRLAALHMGLYLSATLFAFLSLAFGLLARRVKAEGRHGAALLLGLTATLPTLGYLAARAEGDSDILAGICGLGLLLSLGAALSASAMGVDEEEKASELALSGLLSTLLSLLGLAEAMRLGALYNVGRAVSSAGADAAPYLVAELIRYGRLFSGHHSWIPMAVLAPLGVLLLLLPPLKKARRPLLASLAITLLLISASYLSHPSLGRFAPGARAPEGELHGPRR